MYRSLSELRDTVNRLIEQQGENASCAAFLFTSHDVFEYDEDDQERYFSTLFTEDVLAEVGNSDYIYEQIGEVIDDEIRRCKKNPVYENLQK